MWHISPDACKNVTALTDLALSTLLIYLTFVLGFNGLVCENACATAFLCLIMQFPRVHEQTDKTMCRWCNAHNYRKTSFI